MRITIVRTARPPARKIGGPTMAQTVKRLASPADRLAYTDAKLRYDTLVKQGAPFAEQTEAYTALMAIVSRITGIRTER